MIKKGDKVRIIDHQYCEDIRNDILQDEVGKVVSVDEKQTMPVKVKFKCGYEVFYHHELEIIND